MARAVREAETKVMESMREVSGDAATALEVLRDVARETALKPGATFVEVARYAATVAETAADGDAEALATAAEFFERALALMPPTPRGVPELADDWRGFVDEDGEEVAAESWVATAVPALEDEDGQRHRMALACQWCAEFLLLRSPTPPKGPRSASGDWERAEALLRRAAALDPRNGVVAGSLAMLLHRRRADSTVVQRWYERALALMPRQPSVLVKFGNFLKTQGETEAAAAQYRRAIELDEDNAEALGSLAVLLHGTNGDYGAAETLYRRSVDANPFHTNNLGNLGLFLADVRKNYDEAEEMYRRALDTDPSHANTLYNYGVLLENVRHDSDGAEAMYRRAIDANPVHAFALYNLAVLLEDVRKDFPSAETHYRLAIEANPSDPIVLCDFGAFLWNSRQAMGEAEVFFLRALELDPTHATVAQKIVEFAENVERSGAILSDTMGLKVREARSVVAME